MNCHAIHIIAFGSGVNTNNSLHELFTCTETPVTESPIRSKNSFDKLFLVKSCRCTTSYLVCVELAMDSTEKIFSLQQKPYDSFIIMYSGVFFPINLY